MSSVLDPMEALRMIRQVLEGDEDWSMDTIDAILRVLEAADLPVQPYANTVCEHGNDPWCDHDANWCVECVADAKYDHDADNWRDE